MKNDMPITMLESADNLQALEREIATEAARVEIELSALWVASSYPAPIYDVEILGEDALADTPEAAQSSRESLNRAVRYLDGIGKLLRPIAGAPHYVSFGVSA